MQNSAAIRSHKVTIETEVREFEANLRCYRTDPQMAASGGHGDSSKRARTGRIPYERDAHRGTANLHSECDTSGEKQPFVAARSVDNKTLHGIDRSKLGKLINLSP